jgi:DNA invertase Pin-like site-specific DNA recombinase
VRVGYVRVSGVDQNTARQLDGIDVERTFTDHASGKDTERPRLKELIRFVRDGDTVAVHSMDRLARTLEDLRRLVATLTDKGVRVEFVKEGLVFTGEDSPMATFMLSVMGSFAEFERALILERQREGIAAAKARGAYPGRKPALTPEQAAELRRRAAAGESKAALAREYKISWPLLKTAPSLTSTEVVFRRYTPGVADTTIKVDSAVRDRLAVLAAQRGSTIRDLVAELAEVTPTKEELAARQAAAAAYVTEHLMGGFTVDDVAAGERFWRQLEATQRQDQERLAG